MYIEIIPTKVRHIWLSLGLGYQILGLVRVLFASELINVGKKDELE
jgi:hypothetical protein